MAGRRLDGEEKEGNWPCLTDICGPPAFCLELAPPLTPCGLGMVWVSRMETTPAPDENYVWGAAGREFRCRCPQTAFGGV
jgi:hypothetical protein